jgi:hypothetical protein
VAKYKTNWSWWLTPVVLPTQEDHGLKPAQASSSPRPYLEKTLHRKGLVELKPQYCKKKKKKNLSYISLKEAPHQAGRRIRRNSSSLGAKV